MGPLISSASATGCSGYIQTGVDEGGQGRLRRRIPEALPTGWFVEPTVLVNVDEDATVAQEEIFGPVLVVQAHDGDDDAVRVANNSRYGLSGAVFGSPERARAVAERVRTGTMAVNGGLYYGPDVPFGGYKHSGIGREMGQAGFEEYTEIKSIATGRPMSRCEVWITGEQETVVDLLRAPARGRPRRRVPRRRAAPSTRPPRSPTSAGRLAGALADLGVAARRPGGHADRELGRGHAGVVGDRASAAPSRCRSTPPTRASTCATSSPTRGSTVLLVEAVAGRAGRARRRRHRTASSHVVVIGDADARRPGAGPPLGRAARPTAPAPVADVRPVGPGHLHLHRRHDRPVEGLHAEPQLPRHAVAPDRRVLAAHRRRRGVDAAAAVPLQRHRHRRARPAGLRRPGGDRAPLLGVAVLAGDEPRRRHGHLDARHDGLPARPRRRPPGDARVRARPRPTRRCGSSAPRRCRSRSTAILKERFGVDTFCGAYGVDRGVAHVVAAAGRVENKPNAAGVDQRRVLRRPHLRRRRPRAAAGGPTARSSLRPKRPAHDVRGLLGPARGDRRDAAATGGTTPATSAGSTTTATCSSSTARPTTCAAGARTSRASRSSAS